ncbi:MAG: STAS domain-containing protein [Saccharothrix sp.]|nr:STAS domain-containing protein [Saccharothrix sp.]
MPEPAATLASVRVDRPEDGVVVLHVSGELDTSSADELTRPLTEHLVENVRGVVVDLGGVRFLGSAGLESLVVGNQRAGGLGIPLVLVATSRATQRPIEATGLNSVFTVVGSVEEALGRFAGEGVTGTGGPS